MSETTRDARAVVRERLARHGLRARKWLGQHFLIDDDALDAISIAASQDATTVIEIGAGLGTLTERLADRVEEVVAIEHDRDLVPVLVREMQHRSNIRIVEADALVIDLNGLATTNGRTALAGNLPYNISTPLLFRFLEQRSVVGDATVMLQREVAERLTAEAGDRNYGILSVLFSLDATFERVLEVPPGAFLPQPRVHSSVVKLRWRTTPAVEIEDEPTFVNVVKTSFGMRRKTLRNALSRRYSREAIDKAERLTEISLGRRAETLTVAEFATLARALTP